MRYFFIVQGEGRGHMTQALALRQILVQGGHELVGTIIGTSQRREVPVFFEEGMKCPVKKVISPNFVTDTQEKSILIGRTLSHSFRNFHSYKASLKTIAQEITEKKPDAIINFYEILGGLYFLFYRPNLPCICIAHQYLAGHPDFNMAPGRAFDPILFRISNSITAIGAHKKLALSFRELPNHHREVKVVPPLLRNDIFDLNPQQSPYLLAYVVNSGYGEELIQWHKRNPEVKIHCFWDRKGAKAVTHYSDDLTFHKIDGEKFLSMMENCHAYISTAGFESICEAYYLGKPILMVPVKGQYEQHCNALDAHRAGIGISSDHFDISRLLAFAQNYGQGQDTYRTWVQRAPYHFLKALSQFETTSKYSRVFKKIAIAPVRVLLMAL